MRSLHPLLAASLVVASLASGAGCASHTLLVRADLEPAVEAYLFVGVNVFDGEQALGARDVLVRSGVIESVAGPGTIEAPGAVRIEGAGKTLMPGLVDAHGHLEGAGEAIWDAGLSPMDDIPPAYLYAGVTTVIVMQGSEEQFELAARARKGELTAPHMVMAGPRITAPDGFPLNLYRSLLPWPLSSIMTASMLTAGTQEEANAHVDEMARAFHPDLCKITSDAFPPGTPKLTTAVLEGTIARCKERGMRPVAHIGAPEDILIAAEAGLALFAHPPTSAEFTDAQVARLAELKIPFVSTQRFLTGSSHMKDGGTALDREIADATMLAAFAQRPADFTYPAVPPGFDADGLLAQYEQNLRKNVVRLHAANVPVFVGTDAGSPGVIPGSAMQREMRMLVAAGIPVVDVLKAATSMPADFLDPARSFGRIAPRQRADLLLVTGDPTQDIAATEAIVAVFLDGRKITRARRE